MNPTQTFCLMAALAAGGAAQAAQIFDGATDTVYKATTDNAVVALTEPTSGNWVLTNNSADTAHRGYIFGNFTPLALAEGESLTLSFKINTTLGAALIISLDGSQGVALTNADDTFGGFERSYAGYKTIQSVGGTGISYAAWTGGPVGNTTQDRSLIGTTNTGSNTAQTAMGTSTALPAPNRFDSGDSATISMTLLRGATDWQIAYTLEIEGKGGLQSFTSNTLAPSGTYLPLDGEFTSFAIGYAGTSLISDGGALNISDLSIEYNPATSETPPSGIVVVLAGSDLELSFQAASGFSYQLQSSATMAEGTWAADGDPIAGDDTLQVITRAAPVSGKMFYRLDVTAL
ncbi:MAG: hypothetical protein ACP5I4_05535 [Oceanipulchritudo sp.]